MAAVSEHEILEALGQIRDPDKGRDIVTLGMVSGIAIRDGNVAFAIEVEPERGPRLEGLRKEAEKAVEALPGVLSVTAVLTAQAAPRGRPGAQPPGAQPPGAQPAAPPLARPAHAPPHGP
ncbi:MAG: iron-sulfur cluster assembly protein, partial [Stellaceae bacterium]